MAKDKTFKSDDVIRIICNNLDLVEVVEVIDTIGRQDECELGLEVECVEEEDKDKIEIEIDLEDYDENQKKTVKKKMIRGNLKYLEILANLVEMLEDLRENIKKINKSFVFKKVPYFKVIGEYLEWEINTFIEEKIGMELDDLKDDLSEEYDSWVDLVNEEEEASLW